MDQVQKTAYLGHIIGNERYQFLQLIRTVGHLFSTIRIKEEWTHVIATIDSPVYTWQPKRQLFVLVNKMQDVIFLFLKTITSWTTFM